MIQIVSNNNKNRWLLINNFFWSLFRGLSSDQCWLGTSPAACVTLHRQTETEGIMRWWAIFLSMLVSRDRCVDWLMGIFNLFISRLCVPLTTVSTITACSEMQSEIWITCTVGMWKMWDCNSYTAITNETWRQTAEIISSSQRLLGGEYKSSLWADFWIESCKFQHDIHTKKLLKWGNSNHWQIIHLGPIPLQGKAMQVSGFIHYHLSDLNFVYALLAFT